MRAETSICPGHNRRACLGPPQVLACRRRSSCPRRRPTCRWSLPPSRLREKEGRRSRFAPTRSSDGLPSGEMVVLLEVDRVTDERPLPPGNPLVYREDLGATVEWVAQE